MHRMRVKQIGGAAAVWLALLLPAMASAAGIEARVDRTETAVGEPIQLSLVVDGSSASTPLLPGLPDFDVRSAGQSTRVSNINGRSSANVTFTYLLYPKRAGTFTIGAARLDLGGRALESQPILVKVLANNAARKPEDKNLFITAEVSDPSPYVGEQIVYRFRFYRRVGVANASVQLPEFDGFATESLGDQTEYNSVVGGIEYRVTELRKALFAQEAGPRTLPGASLSAEVSVRDKRRRGDPFDDMLQSPFDDFFGRGQRQTRVLHSPDIELTVKALPQPAPAGFTGLVGSFTLEANASKTALKVGESTTLTIVIRGEGNARAIGDLSLPGAPELKIYDDKPELTIVPRGDRVTGSKVFKKALVPTASGARTIAIPSLVTFDPATGAYRTSPGPEIVLEVTDDGSAPEDLRLTMAAPATSAAAKQEVRILAEDIRPMVQSAGHLALQRTRTLTNRLLLAVVLIPPLAFAGFVAQSRRRERARHDVRGERRRKAARRAQSELARARKHLKTSFGGEVLVACSRLLREYLGDKLDVAGAALTPAEARELLERSGVASDLLDRVHSLLGALETAQYARAQVQARDESERLLATTEALITALERQL